MSVVAELFASKLNLAAQHRPAAALASAAVRHDNITIVELSLLWCLIEQRDWAPAVLKEFNCVHRRDSGDCTVHRLPVGFVSALAEVTADRIGALAVDWSGAPELAASPSSVAPFIRAAVDLARRALESDEGLFVWNETAGAGA